MYRILLFIIVFLSSVFRLSAQFSFDTIFKSSPLLKKIAAKPDKYRLQIIYTQIDYVGGKPVFTDYYFNVKPGNYFYCASLVKLPTAILALQKLNEVAVPMDAIMFTDSSVTCHRKVSHDTTSASQYPSIEHYIKKMALVSDNEAYGRVYEFLGVDYIHENLDKAGYGGIRITNRYDGACSGKNNLITNPVSFYDKGLKQIYKQTELNASRPYLSPEINMNVGKVHYVGKKKINAPKNFSGSNYMSLINSHNILQELIFNQTDKFKITQEQRNFLVTYLGYYPRQSQVPKYNPKIFYDSYKKYLYYGDSKTSIKDTNFVITNIVGQSYGFMSDCAHFKDKKNKVEFILSAVIYANEDEIINGKYDYKTIALPYLAELGRRFYNYELKRNKNK